MNHKKILLLLFLAIMSTSSNYASPRSILECVDEHGDTCYEKVLRFHKRKRDEGKRAYAEAALNKASNSTSNNVKKKRAPRGVMQYYDPTIDDVVTFLPAESSWYICYISQPAISGTIFFKKFRNKFRLPFDLFSELVEKVKFHEASFPKRFRERTPTAKFHPNKVPIELLVLGVLRVLGRAAIFNSLEETTYISGETHRKYFLAFITWGSTILYKEFVFYPKTQADIQVNLDEMCRGGMPGCVGSTDATHIAMEQCSARLANAHTGKLVSFIC